MGESGSEEERSNPSTPRGATQLETQDTSGIPQLSTPPPPLPPPHTPTLPPPIFNMANTTNMPIFKGQGLEDPNQFWFVIEAVWKAKKINDEDMNKSQVVTVLQDRALPWYIKYITTNPVASLAVMKNALNTEFKKPKSQSQCITKIKEIKQVVNETTWDVDHRLKCLMEQANF